MSTPRKVHSYAPSAPERITAPVCRDCSARMDLTRISPEPGGHVARHFVCPKCQLSVSVLV
jgi:hypothetical protein